MASNIIDKVHKVTRQSHENRQFHNDFLSNFMQSYSINIGNSSLQDHHDPPKSPSILSKSPAPKTPVSKNLYSTISHAKDPSPIKAFYDLKQNYFSTQPLKNEKLAPEPESIPITESLESQEVGPVVNNVDRLLNKWKRKHESWNLVEEKLVNDLKSNRNAALGQIPNNEDDVDALIMRVKKKINKNEMDDEPQKDVVASVISKYSPQKTPQPRTESSPIVNKSQLSPHAAQGAKYKNQFETALMESDQSPIRPVKDENSQMSFRASFEGEDDDGFLIYRSKGKPPQPQAPSALPQQQIGESKTTDKMSGGSKVSLNQSSAPSDSISFNISESVIGGDQRKSRISEKDNASGESNIINVSQDKPPTVMKDKKPEKIEKIEKSPSPAKNMVEEMRDIKTVEPKNERGIPKAPIMMQKTVKPTYKEAVSEKKDVKSETLPRKKPQFQNSIKSKLNMLKNIYAGRDPNAEVPERDLKPTRQSPAKKDSYDEESSEEKEQKLKERPEILVKDLEEEDKNKNIHAENDVPLSPHRESISLDDLMYSKMTDDKMVSIDESAFKPRVDSNIDHQNFGDHPLIDVSPMPKRQIDFERASELSFTYSPEDSLIHHHDHGRGKENQPGKKVINPQQVVQKVGKIEWNEQIEKEFEAYCDKDPEIIKLRSKINYLKGEIALASL